MLRPTLIVMTILLAGCATAPPPKETEEHKLDRNNGYSLLFKLVSDLKDVDKTLILRSKDQPFIDLVNAIADMAQHAHEQLDAYNKADPTVILTDRPLPPVEIEVRKSISVSEAKDLFTHKGGEFNRRLLVSQASGLNYAKHLARVIQQHETNSARREFLASLETQAHDLRERVVAMLGKPGAE